MVFVELVVKSDVLPVSIQAQKAHRIKVVKHRENKVDCLLSIIIEVIWELTGTFTVVWSVPMPDCLSKMHSSPPLSSVASQRLPEGIGSQDQRN